MATPRKPDLGMESVPGLRVLLSNINPSSGSTDTDPVTFEPLKRSLPAYAATRGKLPGGEGLSIHITVITETPTPASPQSINPTD